MSSQTKAIAYLRGLQEQVDRLRTDNTKWPRSPSESIAIVEGSVHQDPNLLSYYSVTPEMMREAIAHRISQLRDVELPTRFEDPLTYLLLHDEDTLLRQFIGEPCPGVVLGTLPLGRINAASIPVPGSDDFIIVVDQALIYFANRLSMALASALPFQTTGTDIDLIVDLDKLKHHIDSSPNSTQGLHDLLLACLFEGDPGTCKPAEPPAPLGPFSWGFQTSILRFVLAHEYSHIRAGHCSVLKGIQVAPGGLVLDLVDYSWEQELDADVNGMRLTLTTGARQQQSSVLVFAGIDLFFSFQAILEKAATVVRFGEAKTAATETHPPSESRRARIRDVLRTQLLLQQNRGKDHFIFEDQIGEPLMQLGEAIEFLLEHWFQKLIPELEQAHQANRPLAPLWYEVASIERTWTSEPPSLYKATQTFLRNLAESISIVTTKQDIDRAFDDFDEEVNLRYTGNPRRESLISEVDRKQRELAKEYVRRMVKKIFGSRE